MAIDPDDAAARLRRLDAAVAEVADLPFDEQPIETLASVLTTLETVQRRLPTVGYDVINRLRAARVPAGGGRLRDHLASLLNISANDAGTRIATAAALSAEQPALRSTAAAARHGLIGRRAHPDHPRHRREAPRHGRRRRSRAFRRRTGRDRRC